MPESSTDSPRVAGGTKPSGDVFLAAGQTFGNNERAELQEPAAEASARQASAPEASASQVSTSPPVTSSQPDTPFSKPQKPMLRRWLGTIADFRPSFAIRAPHVQTILGPYLPSPELPGTRVHRLELSDGDSLTLHEDRPADRLSPVTAGARKPSHEATIDPPSDEVVILSIHGLGGCHRSGYVRRMAKLANARGWTSFRMDMRGAGDSGKQSTYLYHAGRSDDVLACVQFIYARNPRAKIFVCGFSLGASIVLRLISHHRNEVRNLVAGAVAVSAPLDLKACAENVRRGWNRIYDRSFVQVLWKVLQQRPNAIEKMGAAFPKRRPDSLFDFDDQVTAWLGGYPSASDYYDRFSTLGTVRQIEIPTLAIYTQDDPLIPFSTAKNATWSDSTRFHATRFGGHLGFVGRSPSNPDFCGNRWLEQAIVRSIEQQL